MEQSVIAKLTSNPPSAARARDRGKSKINLTKLTSSHVLLQSPPLRFDVSNVTCATYDDANHALLLCSKNEILVLPTPSPHPSSNTAPLTLSVNEGPILGVKFSLDNKILSLQRNDREIELHLIEGGSSFRLASRRATDKLLGFFWTDCSSCDLVFITSGGVEIYSVKLPGMLVRLVDFRRTQVSWFVYTHESRMLLLASGPYSNVISGIQFSASGIIKVPKFEARLEPTANNSRPVLSSNQVRIVTIYGRIFCLQIDQASYKLRLYRFYRDAVVEQEPIALFSPHIGISVVDNTLVVHQTDSKSIFLYDILSGSFQPLSSPSFLSISASSSHSTTTSASTSTKPSSPSIDSFPKGDSPHLPQSDQDTAISETSIELKGKSPSRLSGEEEEIVSNEEEGDRDSRPLEIMERSISEKKPLVEGEELGGGRITTEELDKSLKNYELYSEKWIFLNPDLIVDFTHGYVWQLKLDLKTIFDSCTDRTALLGFLQRRKSYPTIARSLSFHLIGSLLLNQSDLAIVSSCFDTFCLSFANLAKSHSSKTLLPFSASHLTHNAVLPDKVLPVPHVHSQPVASSSSNSTLAFNKSGSLSEIQEIDRFNSLEKGNLFEVWEEDASNIYQVLDVVHRSAIEALAPSVSPEALVFQILFPLYERGLVKPSYLYAASIELIKSIMSSKLMVPMSLNLLIVDILLKEKRYFELWQLINGKVIGESKELADVLLEAGKEYEPFISLSFKIMNSLKLNSNAVTAFVAQKHALTALRYVRRNRVEDVNVPPILDLASSPSSLPQVLSSVLRFCSDFIPSFRGSALQSKYVSKLH